MVFVEDWDSREQYDKYLAWRAERGDMEILTVWFAGEPSIRSFDISMSPIFADFTKGYSPTLIQAGTKEVILSAAVRYYHALDLAGQDATLDIYEGMWHVFQQNDVPEAEIAVSKSAAFIHEHLGTE